MYIFENVYTVHVYTFKFLNKYEWLIACLYKEIPVIELWFKCVWKGLVKNVFKGQSKPLYNLDKQENIVLRHWVAD